MAQKNHPTPTHTLNEVKEQFKNWRRTRKNPWPIPAKLLKAAVSLTANYTVRQISEELIVDYDDLKEACKKPKKVGKKAPAATFIELDFQQAANESECVVEMENILGAKMRMHFRGKAEMDLLELAKAFWGKCS